MRSHDTVRISVITPSLNHAAYVRDTIESVLAQDWSDIEHIIVDGGSTDGTLEILEAYGRRYPGRFRWISEPDQGQSDAFNKGLAMAEGELIGWQNSDDYYYPGVLGTAARYMTSHPDIAAVYASCHFVSPERDVDGTWHATRFRFSDLLETNIIPNQSALMRKRHLLGVGGLNTEMRYAMDYDLWLRLGVRSKLVRLPGVWGAFRQLPAALTATGWLTNRLETVLALRRLAASPALPPKRRLRVAAAVQHSTFEAILVSLVEGDEAVSDQLLRDSLLDDRRLSEWHDMCRRLLGRSYAGRDTAPNVCRPLLSLLQRHALGTSDQARSVVAISYLKALLDKQPSRTNREICAYVICALKTEYRLLGHRPMIGIAARLILGDDRAFRLEALAKRPWYPTRASVSWSSA